MGRAFNFVALLDSSTVWSLEPVVATDSSTFLTDGGVVMSARIRIGELSRRTGCHIETIRYYERIGLLPAPVRSGGRYRLYDATDFRRLSFIRRARELGFTLDEVRTLVSLSANDGQDACANVRELAENHLVEIRAKIADLRAMERVLTASVRRCAAGEGPGCPILGVLHSQRQRRSIAKFTS
jgi:MerR family transcriptional regulator, mercuric resistance operon regulatory protein